MSPRLSNFLDVTRWVAALSVVLTHVNNRAFVKFAQIPADERNPLLYLWTFLCGFSHHAVVTFFVLSGFLVGGKLLKDLRTIDGQYLKRYATARFARIYIVLIPILGVTALLDYYGTRMPGAEQMYWPGVAESLTSPIAFFGTVLSLQTIWTPLYGSNGALWSLACEVWYYVCAPLLLAPLTRIARPWAWVLFALGVLATVSFTSVYPDFGAGFVLWFMGAAAAVINWRRRINPRFLIVAFIGVLLVFRVVMRAHHMDQFIPRTASDLVVAAALMFVLAALRVEPAPDHRISRFHERLAGFSYSLYAIHTPIIMFICVTAETYFGFGWQERPTSFSGIMLGLNCVLASIVIAYLFSRLTEAHTGRLKDWILKRQPPSSVVSA